MTGVNKEPRETWLGKDLHFFLLFFFFPHFKKIQLKGYTKETQQWLQGDSESESHCNILSLNPADHLWRDQKMALHSEPPQVDNASKASLIKVWTKGLLLKMYKILRGFSNPSKPNLKHSNFWKMKQVWNVNLSPECHVTACRFWNVKMFDLTKHNTERSLVCILWNWMSLFSQVCYCIITKKVTELWYLQRKWFT